MTSSLEAVAQAIKAHLWGMGGCLNPDCDAQWTPDNGMSAVQHHAEVAVAALELCEEWSVHGECNEQSEDCDHFGEHGPWTCIAIAETREEAAAFGVSQSPDAFLVRRWVSSWTSGNPE